MPHVPVPQPERSSLDYQSHIREKDARNEQVAMPVHQPKAMPWVPQLRYLSYHAGDPISDRLPRHRATAAARRKGPCRQVQTRTIHPIQSLTPLLLK